MRRKIEHIDKLMRERSVVQIKKRLADGTISHAHLTKMVGDGWHLRNQGMLFMFLMANVERYPTKLPRQIDDKATTVDTSSSKVESSSEYSSKRRKVNGDDSCSSPSDCCMLDVSVSSDESDCLSDCPALGRVF